MTTLSALLKTVQIAIEKHGPDSPCYFSIWDVDTLQEYEEAEHEVMMQNSKEDPNWDEPGEFFPLSGPQLKHIAEYMMTHDNPNKQWQAFMEAHSTMPEQEEDS